jgi:hypothetical protein
LGVRGINDMLKAVVQKGFNGRVKEWKTKHLRDAFMNALLQAKVTQEVKDAMVGHKRQGAREDYALTELTIKTAYLESFKHLTINGFGSSSVKLEELNRKTDSLASVIAEQQQRIGELEQALGDAQKRNDELEPLVEFVASFKSREELQTFLDLVRASSGIVFPEEKLKLLFEKLKGSEESQAVMTDLFRNVWTEVVMATVDAILQQLKDDKNDKDTK